LTFGISFYFAKWVKTFRVGIDKISYKTHMNILQMSCEHIMNVLLTSYEHIINVLLTSYEHIMNVYECLRNILQISRMSFTNVPLTYEFVMNVLLKFSLVLLFCKCLSNVI
jgi:hypothetical protein